MNRFENEHGDQVQVEVVKQIEKLYLEAEKSRWIAQMADDYDSMLYYQALAAKYEALTLLVAPVRYCFEGYNKFPDMTGAPYQIKVLEEALEGYGSIIHRDNIRDKINELKAAVVVEGKA